MVPVHAAKMLCSLVEAGEHQLTSWIAFLHRHLRDSLSDPKCDEGIHSAPGTTPSPPKAASPFTVSGDSRCHTILGKGVGTEQRKVILTNDHNAQMWASKDMGGRTKIKHSAQNRLPGALAVGLSTVPLSAV